jgi:hypothetical protein
MNPIEIQDVLLIWHDLIYLRRPAPAALLDTAFEAGKSVL